MHVLVQSNNQIIDDIMNIFDDIQLKNVYTDSDVSFTDSDVSHMI